MVYRCASHPETSTISKYFAYYGEQGFQVENPDCGCATELLADFQPRIATRWSARYAPFRVTSFEMVDGLHSTHHRMHLDRKGIISYFLPFTLSFLLSPFTFAQTQWPWLNPNMLEPAGPVAERISNLWWFLFVTASIVFVIVMALFIIALVKRGKSSLNEEASEDRKAHPWFIVGTALTTLILIGTAVYTFLTFNVLAAPMVAPRQHIEVVGKQWWWEIRYNGETIGANELHIPVGETVAIKLSSDNVIHSFWVPQLAGKRDLIPGKTNVLHVRADEAGVYRGFCAEFCGVQHALMGFVVVAESASEFEAWLEQQRSPVSTSVQQYRAGQAVFQNQGCAGCHAVRGTSAQGQLGPDLTHLASRLTIGAATLPNTTGHLGGWVVNSQAVKPGNYMPVQHLPSDDLQDLLEYLEALE